MKCEKFVAFPIFSVFLVMGFVYLVTVFIFIEDWKGLRSTAGSLNAMIFTVLASLSLLSFLVCVLTDPGGVPPAYMPDIEHSGDSDPVAKKSVAHLSHCGKCAAYKPPRAHHCRVCRRCVLRMDHHCLWINNCVGHRNYKAFFVLVIYATVASMYSSIIIVLWAFQKEFNFNGRTPLKIFYITCGIMIVGLSLTLGTLLSWHIYLITQNMTTIEYYEGKRAAWLARKSGQNYRHPFNVGGYKNVTLVLGPNVMKWLCPTAVNHIKDGVDFPTARESL
ncbi:hypothetical protein RJ639_032361 [Escallonia herrerae]|uniref:S-acyltransferase n=1 Tax=Escallonia herrerae TaxID=1293975 RepID=A0AA89B8K3_9ASTE|nr:hypothetical protein RJ639_032361 [Escallonia herrerae]